MAKQFTISDIHNDPNLMAQFMQVERIDKETDEQFHQRVRYTYQRYRSGLDKDWNRSAERYRLHPAYNERWTVFLNFCFKTVGIKARGSIQAMRQAVAGKQHKMVGGVVVESEFETLSSLFD